MRSGTQIKQRFKENQMSNAIAANTAEPMSGLLQALNIGSIRPLALKDRIVSSAFRRASIPGIVGVDSLGLAGDEHGDLRVHGGVEKAVYAYPSEHYAFWRDKRREQGIGRPDETLLPGFLGENLTISGLLEHQVWIGDQLRFPDCVLRITQPRQPCNKFNAVVGFAEAARTLLRARVSGFYLAVDQVGTIQAGQTFTLVPGPRQVTMIELQDAMRARWKLV